jgi:hypothetical protein
MVDGCFPIFLQLKWSFLEDLSHYPLTRSHYDLSQLQKDLRPDKLPIQIKTWTYGYESNLPKPTGTFVDVYSSKHGP